MLQVVMFLREMEKDMELHVDEGSLSIPMNLQCKKIRNQEQNWEADTNKQLTLKTHLYVGINDENTNFCFDPIEITFFFKI